MKIKKIIRYIAAIVTWIILNLVYTLFVFRFVASIFLYNVYSVITWVLISKMFLNKKKKLKKEKKENKELKEGITNLKKILEK